jgi:hypothetical protein
MPWFFKHCTKAERLALEPPVAEADADAEVLLELLPHAAITSAAAMAASTGSSLSARRRILWGDFMSVLS